MIHHGSHAFWRKTTWLGCSGMFGAGVPPPGTLSWESWRLADGTRGACGARGPVTWTPRGPMFARGPAPPRRLNRPPAFAPVLSLLLVVEPGGLQRLLGGGLGRRARCSASSPVRVCTEMRFSSGRPTHFWRGGRTTICDVCVWPAGTSSVCGLKSTLSSLSGSSSSSATVTGALAVFLTATS